MKRQQLGLEQKRCASNAMSRATEAWNSIRPEAFFFGVFGALVAVLEDDGLGELAIVLSRGLRLQAAHAASAEGATGHYGYVKR